MFRRKDVFEPATVLERLFNSPVKLLISLIYNFGILLRGSPAPPRNPIKVVCISDTHCNTCASDRIPDGDLLIHAGDLTNAGTPSELQAQIDWLDSLPHRHKVAIAGNHDTYLDPSSRRTLSVRDQEDGAIDWKGIHYLQHDTITLDFPLPSLPSSSSFSATSTSISTSKPTSTDKTQKTRTLKLYGAPQIPSCGGPEFAYQYPRSSDAWKETIPSDIDILITHTPPAYYLDNALPNLGCEYLLTELWRNHDNQLRDPTNDKATTEELNDERQELTSRKKPLLLHVFGHIHVSAGKTSLFWDEGQRAYERGMSRRSINFLSSPPPPKYPTKTTPKNERKIPRLIPNFLTEILNPWIWIDLLEVFTYSISSILWSRVWAGRDRCTLLVNAALMDGNTGRLGNEAIVVEI